MPQPHPAPDHPALQHLAQALAQAQAALLRASPNPRVGCVLVNPQGTSLARAAPSKPGARMPRSWPCATRSRGATLPPGPPPMSTLGALLPPRPHRPVLRGADSARALSRVLAGLPDPNPLVAGQGFARLRAAGVAVEIASDSATPRCKPGRRRRVNSTSGFSAACSAARPGCA
jgi:diaminohydroxyphosphoribosylaminopyrimidine deaminase/5-amino-6-(5-phosphoribosylamino)uracil reductase